MSETDWQPVVEAVTAALTKYGLQVIGAVLILIVGRIAASIAARATRRVMTRSGTDKALIGFVVSLVRIAIIVFAVVTALAKFGVQTTSFVAVLGAAGLAIGLALQGSLSNFAAGVLIMVFRPFQIGDMVDAAGSIGKVREIGIFTTTLSSPDNKKIIVPNSSITGGTITNVNAFDTRRVDLIASIGYGDDIEAARTTLEAILANHPKVLKDPAPTIKVTELADSSVNFVVRPWVNTQDYWDVYFDVTRSIKEEFDRKNISIPFPQRDVHVHQLTS